MIHNNIYNKLKEVLKLNKIVDWSKCYCLLCKKKFKSRASLYMHLINSKVHKKGTPHYHNPDLIKQEKRLKEQGIDPQKFHKIEEFA